MQGQVADRIEKKLQELPYFDKIETYAKPVHLDFLRLQGFDAAPRRADLFLLLRKKMADVQGRSAGRPDRPRSSTTNSATSIRCSIRSPATARVTRS